MAQSDEEHEVSGDEVGLDLAYIQSFGFDVVSRDPRRGGAFVGAWMAVDLEDAAGWIIVGDDPFALLVECREQINEMAYGS